MLLAEILFQNLITMFVFLQSWKVPAQQPQALPVSLPLQAQPDTSFLLNVCRLSPVPESSPFWIKQFPSFLVPFRVFVSSGAIYKLRIASPCHTHLRPGLDVCSFGWNPQWNCYICRLHTDRMPMPLVKQRTRQFSCLFLFIPHFSANQAPKLICVSNISQYTIQIMVTTIAFEASSKTLADKVVEICF